jgi:Spy/CpxP family protein refolding chaperone
LRKIVFVVLSLALFACATAVFAQQPAPAGPPAGGGRFGGGFMMSCPAMALSPPSSAMIDRVPDLALTDDQKTKLTATLTKAETTLTPYRQKASQAATAVRTAIYGPNYDSAKVAQLVLDAEKADVALANAELAVWTEIRSILKDDQVAKLQVQRRGGFGGGNQPGTAGRTRRQRPGTGDGGNAGGPPEPAPGQ